MTELQTEVGKWHRTTFGETTNDLHRRLGLKLIEECFEATHATDDAELLAELADVMIVCLAWSDRLKASLEYRAWEKLAELKDRPDQIERDAVRGIHVS